MKVHRCQKCGKRGGFLTFRKTKKDVDQKYPYIGHYDPTKKSRKKWCSLNMKQLVSTESYEDWYQTEYRKLIEKSQKEFDKNKFSKKCENLFKKTIELLEKQGLPKPYNKEKVIYNVEHMFITEKYIEDLLPDKYSDKP